ncbi:MAG TPA: class I SAM-dependent methyltransferase [Chitinophagaceae bacterium]|nr:class I SAM-dependent methyltransferase [Chitinophagaceae bacterium]
MSGIVHHTTCPVCGSASINPLLTVRDHSVSKESFVIWQCAECTLRFTQDAPDEASIGRYYQSDDYISHTHTSPGLIGTLYEKVRSFTLGQKAALIRRHTQKEKGRILDIGCGTGAFLNAMQQKGWTVTGVEPDAGARARARSLFGIEAAEPAALRGLPRGQFDAITLWHVLEHVHTLHPYLELLKSLLAPGGVIVIAVPNYTARDAAAYRLEWAAYDVPRHLYHFSPRSMQVLARRHGLAVLEQRPMWFDAFYIALLSSKYRHGKSRWIGAGFQGLWSNLGAVLNRERASSVTYVLRPAEIKV